MVTHGTFQLFIIINNRKKQLGIICKYFQFWFSSIRQANPGTEPLGTPAQIFFSRKKFGYLKLPSADENGNNLLLSLANHLPRHKIAIEIINLHAILHQRFLRYLKTFLQHQLVSYNQATYVFHGLLITTKIRLNGLVKIQIWILWVDFVK